METFEAHHFEVGRMLYSGCTASELIERSVFFFDAEYIVPTSRDGCGTLRGLPAPSFTDLNWPRRPDNTLVALTKRRVEGDVCNAIRCTYTRLSCLHAFTFVCVLV